MVKRRFNDNLWGKIQELGCSLDMKEAKNYQGASICIPDKFHYIGDCAFKNRTKLRTIQISNTCKFLGVSAFEGAHLEKKLIMPDHVEFIMRRAFAKNVYLREVKLSNHLKRMDEGAFQECYRLNKIQFSRQSKCRIIKADAFYECGNLQEIIFPPELIRIERRAFYRCKQLSEVVFPQNLKYIGEQAFYFNAIEELVLPNSLEELGESAFFKCNNLIEVKIPKSVKVIGKWVFHGCNRLKVLEILHDPEYIGQWIINKSATIRCIKNSKVDAYCQKFDFKTQYVDEEERKIDDDEKNNRQ